MSTKLADNILAARQRAGLTQAKLGSRIGRNQKTVAGYEAGKEPPLAVLRLIAENTGTPLCELLGADCPYGKQLKLLGQLAEAQDGRPLLLSVMLQPEDLAGANDPDGE